MRSIRFPGLSKNRKSPGMVGPMAIRLVVVSCRTLAVALFGFRPRKKERHTNWWPASPLVPESP